MMISWTTRVNRAIHHWFDDEIYLQLHQHWSTSKNKNKIHIYCLFINRQSYLYLLIVQLIRRCSNWSCWCRCSWSWNRSNDWRRVFISSQWSVLNKLHSRKKKTKVVDWSSHFEHVDVMSVIINKTMIVCFENIIKRFHHFENAVRVNVEMLDQFNKWVNKEIAIQWRDWLYVWKTFFFMKSLISFCLKIKIKKRAM
jgi:hypothetical protein